MKVKWTKKIPKEEGYYWVKWKRSSMWTSFCEISLFDKGKTVFLNIFRGPNLFAGPNHGGPKLKYLDGNHKVKIVNSIWFSPEKIQVPE